MRIFESEIFRKANGDKGEIMKSYKGGYLVRKYRNFCVMYYAKRFGSYNAAREALVSDGFKKACNA